MLLHFIHNNLIVAISLGIPNLSIFCFYNNLSAQKGTLRESTYLIWHLYFSCLAFPFKTRRQVK